MNLVDIHAHLEHKRFEKDLPEVIQRAQAAGVKLIINSGINPRTNRIGLELAQKYPILKPSFGIYPLDALAKEIENSADGFPRDLEPINLDNELDWIKKNKDKCLAVGEVGLDYNWVTGKEAEQKEIFQKIIDLVEKINKPIVIHSRKAEQDAIDMLESSSIKNVILHCFQGRKSLIMRASDLGYNFSIPPVITRLQHFQLLTSMVDISQLLTETDSPYLSPVAGERNEPANVAVTIREIGKIKNLSPEEVSEKIFSNAKNIFEF